MSEHHQHQHVAMAARSGETIEQAIFNAVAGLTDPQGYRGYMTFDAFEVLDVKGAILRARSLTSPEITGHQRAFGLRPRR
jgi:hypothetical protein